MLMHIISEGALIEGVRGENERSRGDAAGMVALRRGAASSCWRSAPACSASYCWRRRAGLALGLIPGLAAALLAVPAVLAAVPWLLTLYLIYAFGLRIGVLENRQAIDALQKARLFLHGRVLTGLKLIVAMAVGHVGVGLVTVLALLPVGGIAAAIYFLAGLVPAAVVGGVLALPIVLAMAGTLGARSSVWTLGYLAEARG
jgi:hypothetical protein